MRIIARELSSVPLVTQPHLLTPHAGINSSGSCRWKYSNPSPSDIECYHQLIRYEAIGIKDPF